MTALTTSPSTSSSSSTAPMEVADVAFHPLSATEWRVSDSRFPKESIDALLGFVARQGDFFYATRMHHPFEAMPLPSLEHVAEFFVAHHSR